MRMNAKNKQENGRALTPGPRYACVSLVKETRVQIMLNWSCRICLYCATLLVCTLLMQET